MLAPLEAHPKFLIETERLAAHLDEPDLRVIDCKVDIRFDAALVGPSRSSGHEDFERGHIPGAQFVDVVTELSDPASPMPCMVPSAAQFAAAMSRLGVGNASRVVLYSAQNAYWAARVWWLLHLFGFDNASVLNGGWQKWRREGRPSKAGPGRPRPPPAVAMTAALRATQVPGQRRKPIGVIVGPAILGRDVLTSRNPPSSRPLRNAATRSATAPAEATVQVCDNRDRPLLSR